MRTAGTFTIGVLCIIVVLTAFGRTSFFAPEPYNFSAFSFWRDGVPVILTALFAAFLAWSEIISRYRDEPLRATWNPYGLLYLATNATIGLAAFTLLERYPKEILPSLPRSDGILLAFVSGFGAMAVLRSKLFLYRTEDKKEIPIGPDLVIERFLSVVDRKIDRLRAAERQALVFELMRKYADYPPASEFFTLALTSFQNLSDEEKKHYLEKAKELGASGSADAFKAMALGFLFLDIAGEENLKGVSTNLDKYLEERQARAPANP